MDGGHVGRRFARTLADLGPEPAKVVLGRQQSATVDLEQQGPDVPSETNVGRLDGAGRGCSISKLSLLEGAIHQMPNIAHQQYRIIIGRSTQAIGGRLAVTTGACR